MCWGLWGGNWVVGLIMMLIGFLLFAAIIVLIIWAIAYFTRQPGHIAVESPLDILNKRHARGEITKEDYDRMKSELAL